MDLGLTGKNAIVMASSQGLGRAIATELAREGAQVVISGRGEAALAEAAEAIRQETDSLVRTQVCDVTKPADLEALVKGQGEAMGGLDVLVTNAGGPPAGTFGDMDDAKWQAAFELNLMSAVRAVRLALPLMRARGEGRIAAVTSSSIRQPIDGLILSNVFRAGVHGLMKSLSNELAGEGILVNTVAPGRIDTDRVRSLDKGIASKRGASPEEVRAGFEQIIPRGRYGEPAEFGRAVAWLCSWANTYITGQALLIDGGLVRAL